MPLTTSEKAALVATADTLSAQVAALVIDPDTNPLQAQLDAALAQVVAMQEKVANAKLALQQSVTADAAEDAARNAALQALE